MARIRTVKPEFFRHEGLQDLEVAHPESRPMLVFAGLWGHCDKAGRFEWKPRTLKLDILPFMPFDMAETLELLVKHKFILKYTVNGVDYGAIPSFADHQRIGGKEADGPEKYPAPPEDASEKQHGSNGEATGKQRGAQEGKGREGKGVDVGLKPDVKQLRAKAIELLGFLNDKTGRSYQAVPVNIDMIVARLKDGATVEDCRAVIAKKCREWQGDAKMAEYLRPATLFNRTKFAQYQGALGKTE